MMDTVAGIPADKVKIHQMRMGGGFGRRLMNDYVCEVAAIARRLEKPVQLVWTREADTAYDFFRVGGFHRLWACTDAKGRLTGWKGQFHTFTDGSKTDDGQTRTVPGGDMHGGICPFPFVPNLDIRQVMWNLQVPCGWWRAPGSCSLAFVFESFLHEISSAVGRDHRDFLLEILGEPRWLDEGNAWALHTGRAAEVIKLACRNADWGKPLPEGRGRGLAFYFSHQGYFAEVAEVTVESGNQLRLDRVVVAGDVGLIVNKSGAYNQIEGSVVDGYSAMVGQQITFQNGSVQQSNFDDYPLLRMPQHPKIEIHMIESDYGPSGLGEPALPPLAPAVCNAVYEATGTRIRKLPLTKAGFSV